MSKSLTLSMSLALALGFSGVSLAGHGGNAGCETCGLASPQGTIASPQASPQGGYETCDTCAPAKKKHGLKCFQHKPKMYTYEWVLKKKKVHGHHNNQAACETCGTSVYPSGQYSSPQYGSPQGTYAAPQATYGAPQATYGAPQASLMPTSEMRPAAPAPAGDAVPPAPVAPPAPAAPAPPAPSASNSLLFLSPAGN